MRWLRLSVMLLGALLAACNGLPGLAPTVTVAPTTVPPTSAPPTATPPPTVAPSATATSALPTTTPTSPPTLAPTTVPTAAPGEAIAHLSAGQPISITTIQMLDATHGWATGGIGPLGDHVLATADGGRTWRDVTPPQPAPAPDAQPGAATGYFSDASTAWVVYGTFNTAAPATVWNTIDAGQHWRASLPVDLASLTAEFFVPSDVDFLDSQTGWFVAHLGAGMMHDYFTLFQTTDGGQSWAHLIDPTAAGPQSCSKTGLHFTSAQVGFLTGDCQGVAPGVFFMRTGDGGATWQDAALPAPASAPDLFTRSDAGCGTYGLTFFDAQSAKMAVSCLILSGNPITKLNFVYATADGGGTWTSAQAPARNLTFVDAQTGWALPEADPNAQPPFDLSRTLDGGATWAKIKSLAWTGALDFVDAQTGWAVAHAGDAEELVQTSDGGQTWQALQPRIAP